MVGLSSANRRNGRFAESQITQTPKLFFGLQSARGYVGSLRQSSGRVWVKPGAVVGPPFHFLFAQRTSPASLPPIVAAPWSPGRLAVAWPCRCRPNGEDHLVPRRARSVSPGCIVGLHRPKAIPPAVRRVPPVACLTTSPPLPCPTPRLRRGAVGRVPGRLGADRRQAWFWRSAVASETILGGVALLVLLSDQPEPRPVIHFRPRAWRRAVPGQPVRGSMARRRVCRAGRPGRSLRLRSGPRRGCRRLPFRLRWYKHWYKQREA